MWSFYVSLRFDIVLGLLNGYIRKIDLQGRKIDFTN